MKKHFKKVAAVLLALLLVAGIGAGGYTVYQNYHGGSVPVYSVEYLYTTNWQEETETDSTIKTDKLQTEYLSDTQTVEEIKVKEGQEVKKGDVLFTYDSTLTELDVQKKEVELQQKKLELQDINKQIKVIRTYRAGVPIPGSTSGGSSSSSSTSEEEEEIPTYEGLELLSGSGTAKDPYCYLWQDTFQFTDDFLAAAMQGDYEAYVTFYLTGQDVTISTDDPADDPTNGNDSNGDDNSGGDSSNSGDNSGGSSSGSDNSGGSSSGGDTSGGSSSGGGSTSGGDNTSGSDTSNGSDSSGGGSTGENDPADSGESGSASSLKSAASAPVLNLLTSTTGSEDASGGETQQSYSASWTMQCQHSISGYCYKMLSMTVGGVERTVSEPMDALDPSEYPDADDGDIDWDDGGDTGITYTGAEIAAMLKEQQEAYKTADLEYRQLQMELKQQQKELNNSAVYSEWDGKVTLLNDPDDLEDGQPLVKVSGGGGYLIEGTLSELDLGTVTIGQTITVTDWNTDSTYEGTVQEISDYPQTDGSNYYYGSGNSNASYYPFTVAVSEDANLQEDSWVTMTYTAGGSDGEQNLYLLKSFVRTENGKSYVYLDRDGVLEKCYVTTGKDLWGSYIEITSGNVSMEDSIAFPYGQKVKEGAATEEGSIDELYGY